jgi:hypothetical protein
MVATMVVQMLLVVVKSQKGEGPYVLGAEAILLCLAKISCLLTNIL